MTNIFHTKNYQIAILQTEFPHDNFLSRIFFWSSKYDIMPTTTIKTGLDTHDCLHAISVISFLTKLYLNNKPYE